MKYLIPLILLLSFNVKSIAQSTTDKVLWTNTDSLKFKMLMSETDDIYFRVYDYQMSKVKIDTVGSDCFVKFNLGITIPLKLVTQDQYTLKATLENFKGYIKFKTCELHIMANKHFRKIIFINK